MRNRGCSTTVICAGLLLLIFAGTSHAQRIEPVAVTSSALPKDSTFQASREPISTTGGVIGGVVGAAVGMYVGGMVGQAIAARQPRCDDCGNVLIPVLAGESIGLAMGAHYGSGGNANPFLTSLVSTGVGVAGLFAAYGAPIMLAVTPIAQLAAVLIMERQQR